MIKLYLSKDIYSLESVLQAKEDYASIAEIQVETVEKDIVCIFESTVYDEKTTVKEFENYLIDLTNSNRDYE